MENTNNVTPSISSARLTGCVKWFNNKAGYGFITVSDESQSDIDVFVHHSAITIPEHQYKYLVQGEYVSFNLLHTETAKHATHAANVSGINNGKLMCETRNEARIARSTHTTDEVASKPRPSRPSSAPRRTNPRAPSTNAQRGGENSEWKLVQNSSERPRQTTGQRTKSDGNAN